MVSVYIKKWSRQKDEFLAANHGKVTNIKIAECLGCSIYALELRIKELKLI